jgi:hypothetical protein
MRIRLLPLAALCAAIVAWPAAAGEKKSDKPTKPTLVVRLASLDNLIADARYLAELAGKGNEAEQAEKMLKAMAGGDKGLGGLDTTKPMGLYGYLGPGGIDSQAVILLPIRDEKAFTDKIESFGLKPEKADGGAWKLDIEQIPFAPVYFRFANKYVYATVRDLDVLDKDRLLDPATVLAGSGFASAVINLDGIPKELKEMALAQTELQIANAKEKDTPNETKAQKALRQAVLDEAFQRLKELLNDGGALSAHFEVDRTAGELSLTASLAGKAESKLAAGIAELGKITSVAAGAIGSDAAMSIQLDVALPKNLREVLTAVVEEGMQQGLEKEKDEAKRKVAESLVKVITPTIKMGELDASVSLRGPDASGVYTLVGVGKIKDGKSVEAALKEALKESPVKEQGSLAIDFAKVGDVNIHKAVPDKVDDKTRTTLGDGPVYFAFRDDALIVAGGSGALDAIKSAIAAGPAPGKIAQIELAFSRFAKLMTEQTKAAPDIAKKVFKGGDDTLSIALEGGAALKLGLRMKAKLVTFIAGLEEAKRE